jgi:hypothetical protein
VFLDATYCKARVNRRVVSQAVVIATGVAADGHREVLGFAVGDSEDGAFWTAFLRTLKARGLAGTQLVISDAHTGLKQAISAVLLGTAWQRCRVHFLRNVLARVAKGNAEMVAAAIRTVFAQPDAEHVRSQLDVIAGMLGRQFPQVEAMLRDAAEDLLAFTGFPGRALEEGLVDQSAGAAEQGDQAAHRRRRRLLQSRSPAPVGRSRAGRGPRRMAGLRPPLPLRGLHGPACLPQRLVEGGGAAGPDRVIVTKPLTNTMRTTSTTQRDVTVKARGQGQQGSSPRGTKAERTAD